MQKDQDLRAVADFVERIVRQAGQVILSFSERELVIERKNIEQSAVDIVTDADRASEQIILEAITKEFPGHDIVSEETLPQLTDSRWKWFVDPLDGTVNFAHHYPFFSVSVALMDGRDLVVGLVYDPLRDECFLATRNGGAFLNGRAIRVSASDRLEKSIVATGFPYDRATSRDNNVTEFSKVVTRVQGMRRCGSAAIDLAYVACGRLDGFWELKLKPWDMAAGMLLVQEAGGRVSDRTGGSTDVYTPCVVATNGLIHHMLTGLLSSD